MHGDDDRKDLSCEEIDPIDWRLFFDEEKNGAANEGTRQAQYQYQVSARPMHDAHQYTKNKYQYGTVVDAPMVIPFFFLFVKLIEYSHAGKGRH